MIRRIGAIAVILLSPLLANAAATRPTTRPDPHLWAKRNVELIRQAADAGKGIGSALMFSVGFNPLIVREPYASETLKIAEAALAKPPADKEEMHNATQEAAQVLRQPEDERILRQFLRATGRPDKPLVRAAYGKMHSLSAARLGEPYETLFPRLIDQVDADARHSGDWGRLALGYSQLAHQSLDDNQPKKAALYIDRMLAILREHPEFEDPNRGNTNNVAAHGLARLLIKAGRREDLDALVQALNGQPKIDLLVGIAGSHAREGRLDEARRVVETQLRPIAPAVASRIAAALDGKSAPPSTTTTTSPAAGRKRESDPAELRLQEVLAIAAQAVAEDHARRGDIDTASRLLIAFHATQPYLRSAGNTLPSGEWARVAKLAAAGGHADAARAACQRALDALSKEKENGSEVKSRLVRDALDAGRIDVAAEALQTPDASHPASQYRLAKAYREQGMLDRARALAEEALTAARADDNGHTIAAVAADVHADGDVKRAESLLLEAMNHLDGEGFGFGVTGAVVSAASRMNRLDLLDRIYERGLGDKTLLCIVATRAGVFPRAAEED